MDWTNIEERIVELDNIQDASLQVYGRYDLDKSIIWMVEELGEVVAAIRKGKTKEEISGELGDLMAWIFCLGNIMNIKISDALRETFFKEFDRQIKVYGKLKYASTEIFVQTEEEHV
ncbi:MazG nucleotide pyrophosphohydrolase domain-containing protein [Paenibacillus medicaginis]|uniref:MazG nucleotide pyrophosphohydrolase domain-containing protein n=1 Tax=Paenibacillus medicaginis TaxID=1470560 RepID=A0ABV5C3N3_9BACL